MLSFLFFIVIFVLVICLMIISTVFGFIRSIFSFGKNKNQNSQSQKNPQPTPKSKIFGDTEGEYVDYEEV